MSIFFDKVGRVLKRKFGALLGSVLYDLEETLRNMALRPFELNLELTNLCNAECVFCPYQFQERPHELMSDEVFKKAVQDYVNLRGGSVGITPIVGEALIDSKFLERVRHIRSFPEIDRIFLTTNAILLDKVGIREILTSGITTINISTASFDEENYRKIFRSSAYERMKKNVTHLVEENSTLDDPVNISIGLRTDRPLNEVMKDPDIQPILNHNPHIDFTWSYSSGGGRLGAGTLPGGMEFRKSPVKNEPCVSLYNGPIVLPGGEVLACSCIGAMDAIDDLKIGNVLEDDLLEIYAGQLMQKLRGQFRSEGVLNETCANCDAYRNLELYRTSEGRERATVNLQRHDNQTVKRARKGRGIFTGG